MPIGQIVRSRRAPTRRATPHWGVAFRQFESVCRTSNKKRHPFGWQLWKTSNGLAANLSFGQIVRSGFRRAGIQQLSTGQVQLDISSLFVEHQIRKRRPCGWQMGKTSNGLVANLPVGQIVRSRRAPTRRATPHWGVAFRWFESVRGISNKKTPSFWMAFSYLATSNGLEPSTSSVTGWRANRLHHEAMRSEQEELYQMLCDL